MTQRRTARPARPGGQRPERSRQKPGGKPPRRRRSRMLLPVLVALALVIWMGLDRFAFVVRDVQVVGAGDVPAETLIRLSGIQLGGSMRAIDEKAIDKGVESTGRFALVGVEKRYPSTVVINVRERGKDAIIFQAGKMVLLDSDGYVVDAQETMPAISVPYITGLKPTSYHIGKRLDALDTRLDAMKAVLEALKAQGVTAIVSELNVEDVDELILLTRKGTTVLLGDADNMPAKIAWMSTAIRDLDSRGESLGRLDVSSGVRADFMRAVTPSPEPVVTQEPLETPGAAGEAVIGENAI